MVYIYFASIPLDKISPVISSFTLQLLGTPQSIQAITLSPALGYMIANLPTYKRVMTYLGGEITMKRLDGFCVVEHVGMIMPESIFEPTTTSIIVSLKHGDRTSPCGCTNNYVKEFVNEIPYESGTFSGDAIA